MPATPRPAPPPAVRLPSLDGLLAFEAAARLASLERAAEELCIGASAVSKRISALEELLGTPLLQRSAKPLALTTAGKEYLEQLRPALALLTAMPLHRRSQQRRERLRITAPPTFARQILVPALPEFQAGWPGLELELVLSSPYVDEASPPGDIEIRGDIAEQVPPQAEVLALDPVTPMASPDLLARLPAILEPADLRQAPLLRTPLQAWTPWLRAAGLDWPEPDTGTRFVDLGLTLTAAACGQGVALSRPSLAAPWLATGELRRLFPHVSVPAAHVYSLLRHGEASAAGEALAAWLVAHCAQLSEQSAEDSSAGA